MVEQAPLLTCSVSIAYTMFLHVQQYELICKNHKETSDIRITRQFANCRSLGAQMHGQSQGHLKVDVHALGRVNEFTRCAIGPLTPRPSVKSINRRTVQLCGKLTKYGTKCSNALSYPGDQQQLTLALLRRTSNISQPH